MRVHAIPRKLVRVILYFAFALTALVFAQSAAERSDELTLLERFTGTWDTIAVSEPGDWTPEGMEFFGYIHCESILDGQVVQGNGRYSRTDGTESDNLTLWTYNKRIHSYQFSHYISYGTVNHYTGQLDPNSNTLILNDARDDGSVDTFSFEFENANTINIVREFKDSDGKQLYILKGTWTRRK